MEKAESRTNHLEIENVMNETIPDEKKWVLNKLVNFKYKCL